MKTKNSIKNSIIALVQYTILIIVGFIAQKFFIKFLGIEYLGLNGLFTNIISMLGIVELGVGNAIIYNLYKPLVNKDYETINSLMKFYRQAYHIIAIIVFLIGMAIIPFLNFFITEITIDINIVIVYILFILEIVASYLLSYKRSILYADQKNYIVNIIHIIYYIILNTGQLVYLYLTKNYYGYLIIKIAMRIIENIAITLYVNKHYKELNIKNANKIEKSIFEDIKKKVSALFLHKVASFIVLSTDNIIISRYLGLVTVGLYSNYHLIIDSLTKLFGQAITAITPSVGHLLVEDNPQKNYEVFKKIRFMNFWIASFAGIGLLIIIKPFITIWLGKEYLLSTTVLVLLVINFFQKMMRNAYLIFKEAAGIYYEDRIIPILESITNIITSIILVKILGLPGVFIGTIISGFWIWCYTNPVIIYKKLFKRSYKDYVKETISYIVLFLIIAIFTYILSSLITCKNIWLSLIINGIITLVIPNLIIILIFNKTENYQYFINLTRNIIKKGEKHE